MFLHTNMSLQIPKRREIHSSDSFSPLRANPTSVIDHFVGLALKGLRSILDATLSFYLDFHALLQIVGVRTKSGSSGVGYYEMLLYEIMDISL